MSCYSEYNFLNTGDLLLCDYDDKSGPMGWFSGLIKYFTKSNYSHVAMVLKDPTYINENLKGIYVWESSYEGRPDPQDGKIKLGVQITPIGHFIDYYKKHGYVVYRKLIGPTDYFKASTLSYIHHTVYDKPSDIAPRDWINALRHYDSKPKKTTRFWCSALIGYIYSQLGVIDKKVDWSILRASDFSKESESEQFSIKPIGGFSLGLEIQL
jgi:cell wall-associated NlpC family hydrolase